MVTLHYTMRPQQRSPRDEHRVRYVQTNSQLLFTMATELRKSPRNRQESLNILEELIEHSLDPDIKIRAIQHLINFHDKDVGNKKLLQWYEILTQLSHLLSSEDQLSYTFNHAQLLYTMDDHEQQKAYILFLELSKCSTHPTLARDAQCYLALYDLVSIEADITLKVKAKKYIKQIFPVITSTALKRSCSYALGYYYFKKTGRNSHVKSLTNMLQAYHGDTSHVRSRKFLYDYFGLEECAEQLDSISFNNACHYGYIAQLFDRSLALEYSNPEKERLLDTIVAYQHPQHIIHQAAINLAHIYFDKNENKYNNKALFLLQRVIMQTTDPLAIIPAHYQLGQYFHASFEESMIYEALKNFIRVIELVQLNPQIPLAYKLSMHSALHIVRDIYQLDENSFPISDYHMKNAVINRRIHEARQLLEKQHNLQLAEEILSHYTHSSYPIRVRYTALYELARLLLLKNDAESISLAYEHLDKLKHQVRVPHLSCNAGFLLGQNLIQSNSRAEISRGIMCLEHVAAQNDFFDSKWNAQFELVHYYTMQPVLQQQLIALLHTMSTQQASSKSPCDIANRCKATLMLAHTLKSLNNQLYEEEVKNLLHTIIEIDQDSQLGHYSQALLTHYDSDTSSSTDTEPSYLHSVTGEMKSPIRVPSPDPFTRLLDISEKESEVTLNDDIDDENAHRQTILDMQLISALKDNASIKKIARLLEEGAHPLNCIGGARIIDYASSSMKLFIISRLHIDDDYSSESDDENHIEQNNKEYDYEITSHAYKALTNLTALEQELITKSLQELISGNFKNVKKLKGAKKFSHRLKVNNIRAGFSFIDTPKSDMKKTILIKHIGKRENFYS